MTTKKRTSKASKKADPLPPQVEKVKRPPLQTVKFRQGEPLPTALQDLIHKAAEKVAQDIVARRDAERTTSNVQKPIDPKEMAHGCVELLNKLQPHDRTRVIAYILNWHRQDIEGDLNAYRNRQEHVNREVIYFRDQLDKLDAIELGRFAVVNF